MAKQCPACGQMMPSAGDATDSEIIAAINDHDGMIYARGLPRGGADLSQWFVTRGHPSGPFSHGRVLAMVAKGQLVKYCAESDAAYTTPASLERIMRKYRARLARRAAPSPTPSTSHGIGIR